MQLVPVDFDLLLEISVDLFQDLVGLATGAEVGLRCLKHIESMLESFLSLNWLLKKVFEPRDYLVNDPVGERSWEL